MSAKAADDQHEVPQRCHPAALLQHHRVQERRGDQPGQQRDVLDRVPGPVPAPAQHGVGPERAERQSDGQEAPHGERPSADQRRPTARIRGPASSAAIAEGERHREPDEPEVQERRVHRHQRVVLQQRGRAPAVRRGGGERRERPRGTVDQQQVEGLHAEQHAQRVGVGRGVAAAGSATPRRATYPARMRFHSSSDPSSAAHRESTLKNVGVPREEFSATYRIREVVAQQRRPASRALTTTTMASTAKEVRRALSTNAGRPVRPPTNAATMP